MQELKQWEMTLNTSKAKGTVISYMSDVKIFMNWIKEKKKVEEVDLELFKTLNLLDLNEFISYLMTEKNNGIATRNRKINVIRGFYKYLKKNKLIAENIAEDLEIPDIPKRKRLFLTEEEINELMDKTHGCHRTRDLAITSMFYNTGMRLSELANINIDDLKDNFVRTIGKGDIEEWVYLNAKTMKYLNEWLKIRPDIGNPALFISEQKNRMANNTIQKMIKANLKRIGRSDCSVHKLRHSFATKLLDNGEDIRTIQKLLKHKNLNTTAIYTHVTDRQMMQAVDSL